MAPPATPDVPVSRLGQDHDAHEQEKKYGGHHRRDAPPRGQQRQSNDLRPSLANLLQPGTILKYPPPRLESKEGMSDTLLKDALPRLKSKGRMLEIVKLITRGVRRKRVVIDTIIEPTIPRRSFDSRLSSWSIGAECPNERKAEERTTQDGSSPYKSPVGLFPDFVDPPSEYLIAEDLDIDLPVHPGFLHAMGEKRYKFTAGKALSTSDEAEAKTQRNSKVAVQDEAIAEPKRWGTVMAEVGSGNAEEDKSKPEDAIYQRVILHDYENDEGVASMSRKTFEKVQEVNELISRDEVLAEQVETLEMKLEKSKEKRKTEHSDAVREKDQWGSMLEMSDRLQADTADTRQKLAQIERNLYRLPHGGGTDDDNDSRDHAVSAFSQDLTASTATI